MQYNQQHKILKRLSKQRLDRPVLVRSAETNEPQMVSEKFTDSTFSTPQQTPKQQNESPFSQPQKSLTEPKPKSRREQQRELDAQQKAERDQRRQELYDVVYAHRKALKVNEQGQVIYNGQPVKASDIRASIEKLTASAKENYRSPKGHKMLISQIKKHPDVRAAFDRWYSIWERRFSANALQKHCACKAWSKTYGL